MENHLLNQGTTRRVVIAEDNDDMRGLLRDLIEGLGVEVVEAASGGDLMILLTNGRPIDLLITDVQMPWATGFQVSQAARKAGWTMPIIVVTSFGDDQLRELVHRLGAATLLAKPFRPEELLALARSYLPA